MQHEIALAVEAFHPQVAKDEFVGPGDLADGSWRRCADVSEEAVGIGRAIAECQRDSWQSDRLTLPSCLNPV